ncbi:hypothetical protein G6F66_006574 [Rhizopus arrhizus]|nr:hypothetical protein G6F66_006574 [Rhizopus arrhizus]
MAPFLIWEFYENPKDQVDQRDLCEIIKTPVIESSDYRPLKHYDLRTIENVAGNWIDLMCSPSNYIPRERGERTSAIGGVIPILKSLFRPFNDIVTMRWIEIEEDGTKRHKWDGVMNHVDSKAAVMLIEFAGGFVNVDSNKLLSDTIKTYRNTARILNSKNSDTKHPPYRVYVRTRKATLDIPYYPGGLKTAVKQFPDVFSWRNTVIGSVKNAVSFNNANIETIPVPSTP